MKNKIFLFIFAFIFLVETISLSSAWIPPDTHDYLYKEALLQAPNSPVGQVIANNFEDFSACSSLTDYSVFFYFQQGFSTIGKVYLGSHNNLICPRAVELADKNNPGQLACAYGICGHEMTDTTAHNGFVPMVIDQSGMVNVLVHASSEQCVNSEISTPQLSAEGRSALVNKYPVHKEFLIKVFQSDARASSINVGNMMDAFVSEVAQNDQYTVGFRGFTAIPILLHVILLLVFLLSLAMMTLLIRRKQRTKFNNISIIILIIPILFVVLVYVLFFTGNIWRTFQAVNTPLCYILPISGYEQYLNEAVRNVVNLYNNGADVTYQIKDPAGLESLHNADAKNSINFYVIISILIVLLTLFVWLNFRRKKR